MLAIFIKIWVTHGQLTSIFITSCYLHEEVVFVYVTYRFRMWVFMSLHIFLFFVSVSNICLFSIHSSSYPAIFLTRVRCVNYSVSFCPCKMEDIMSNVTHDHFFYCGSPRKRKTMPKFIQDCHMQYRINLNLILLIQRWDDPTETWPPETRDIAWWKYQSQLFKIFSISLVMLVALLCNIHFDWS